MPAITKYVWYRIKSYSNTVRTSPTGLFCSILTSDDDTAAVQTYLQEGADIDVRNLKGYTPLLWACFHYQIDIVELLLKSGANVDCCNEKGYTVLHYASRNSWPNIVRSLAKKVPDLNVQDISGETPMHHASRSGKLSVVKCLIELGADINRKNVMDFTPLLYAAQNSYKDIVDLLLDSGANVDGSEELLLYFASRNRWTGMMQAFEKRVLDVNKRHVIGLAALDVMSSTQHLEVVKCLMEKGTENNRKMIYQAALYDASSKGHLEVVKWLVKKEPDMKTVLNLTRNNVWGMTALHRALRRGHLEVAKCLVEARVDINATDDLGKTALHVASGKGHLEIVKCLMEKKAGINISDMFGETALYEASYNSQLEVVKYLVKKGADINVQNINGCTAILCASRHSNKEVVDLLICSGANIDGNHSMCTVLHMASACGWIDTVQSLVKKGCDLDARDKQGITALGSACLTQAFDTVQYLLQAGARWDIVDGDGDSPLNYLTKEKSPEMKLIKLFIDNGAYLKNVDYDAMIKNSSLNILQDIKLCCQSILNKFNYYDLSELYKLPVSTSLPCIEKLRIVSGSEVAQSIERTLELEKETKGHCNILEVCPMALGIFSVVSILEYYKKKKLEFKNQLKRPVVFDLKDKYQHASKRVKEKNKN